MIFRLRAYAELLRVSNVLTAVADVWMGMIVATGSLAPASVSVPLTAASVLLYLSGMVLNDVFDTRQDARERPTRPIPSGRVSRGEAAALGWSLLISGVAMAGVFAWSEQRVYPLAVAASLAAAILLYDAVLKRTMIASVAMGMCRGLNVLLGLTCVAHWEVLKSSPSPPNATWFIVGGLITYVTGMTLFARSEAHAGQRLPLTLAAALSLSGLGLLAAGPELTAALAERSAALQVPIFRWRVLWLVVTLLVARRYVAAILQPTPGRIQAAVGNAIQSIILIDAALAFGYAGQFWGLAILALLPPTMLMARFVPQT